MKKLILPMVALATVFASCTKEPTACFTPSPASAEVHQVVNLTNCSEDADSYEWTITDTWFGTSSTLENPTMSWDEPGTYSVTLKAISKNEKKDDEVSSNVTVTDVCYVCEEDDFGLTVDICGSDYFTGADFEDGIEFWEDAGYTCTKQ